MERQLSQARMEGTGVSMVVATLAADYYVAQHRWPSTSSELFAAAKEPDRDFIRYFLSKISSLRLEVTESSIAIRFRLDGVRGMLDEGFVLLAKGSESEILESMVFKVESN